MDERHYNLAIDKLSKDLPQRFFNLW